MQIRHADSGGLRWVPIALVIVAVGLLAIVGIVELTEAPPSATPAAAGSPAPAVASTPPADAASPAAGAGNVGGLVGQLKAGGHVLYLRHAARTDDETVVTDPADCTQQANLTDEGRAQATAIGEAFRSLAIPVGAVYASPYCRTTETAQLAFGTVTPVAELAGGTLEPPVDPAAQAQVLNGLLGTAVPGTNVVIVGHSEVIEAVTGETTEAFAETVVFQPQGDGSYAVVDHVLFERLVGWVQSCPPECS